MVRPSGRTPILATHTQSSLSACNLDAALSPQSHQCMRMPPKRPIGGSGDSRAAEAPEHGVEMETEVAVIAGELLLHPDVVDGVELPQPEPEFHADSDDHSDDDSNNDGQLVSHLYPFMCQIDHWVSLVTPASPFLE